MAENRLDRRSWMSGVGAAAAGMALGAARADAQTPATPPQGPSPAAPFQPARHALGALLLEQGRVAEAAEVYRADLGFDGTLSRPCQHPDNVWSLFGYHQCLVKLGRAEEANIIKPRLDLAKARATVPVESSCFCSRSAGSCFRYSRPPSTIRKSCCASLDWLYQSRH